MFIDLSSVGLVIFGFLLFLGLIGAFYAGGQIGLWRRGKAETDAEGVGFVVSGMIGLLAFSLGLTLSMAQGRLKRAVPRHSRIGPSGRPGCGRRPSGIRAAWRLPGCSRTIRGCGWSSSRQGRIGRR